MQTMEKTFFLLFWWLLVQILSALMLLILLMQIRWWLPGRHHNLWWTKELQNTLLLLHLIVWLKTQWLLNSLLFLHSNPWWSEFRTFVSDMRLIIYVTSKYYYDHRLFVCSVQVPSLHTKYGWLSPFASRQWKSTTRLPTHNRVC